MKGKFFSNCSLSFDNTKFKKLGIGSMSLRVVTLTFVSKEPYDISLISVRSYSLFQGILEWSR